jgi:hypothetical protein
MEADLHLVPDCGSCFGLCCAAPALVASPEFAIDKPGGQPCPHLAAGFRCDIHARLRQEGFAGCALFDCHGAGQKVSQVTFGGRDWRRSPDLAAPMFAAFAIMHDLHTLLWYLSGTLALPPAAPLRAELTVAVARTERLTRLDAAELLRVDVAGHGRAVGALLLRAGELVRAEVLTAFGSRARWSAAELARETGLDLPSLTSILTRLVRDGRLATEPAPGGPRYVSTAQRATPLPRTCPGPRALLFFLGLKKTPQERERPGRISLVVSC